MEASTITPRDIRTLHDFYLLCEQIAEVRRRVVLDFVDGRDPDPADARSLENALESLRRVPKDGNDRILAIDEDKSIRTDLNYEIGETEKDLVFMRTGEERFMDHRRELHRDFDDHVLSGVEQLGDLHFHCFVTDRDGTTNNYCARYRSSVQPAWNAVYLTRFARARTANPIFITSAPLRRIGIVDISVNPPGSFIYGASKGRECLDLVGSRHTFPIDAEKQDVLDRFNTSIAAELAKPEYAQFALIGSGLQYKFGQTTVARQDIAGSIPEAESLAFLNRVEELMREVDPGLENLRIEDTGLDLEIILTVESAGGEPKDFDKADGVRFMDEELSIGMAGQNVLVCGDTGSDVPMIEAALDASDRTHAIFVTKRSELAQRVHDTLPEAIVVPEPDMLVAILRTLATQS